MAKKDQTTEQLQEQAQAQAPAPKKTTVKSLFENETMKARVHEILGKNAATFTTSVIQLVNQSKQLSECDPVSVVNSAMVAATLELPLNNNLGFAYVVPYNVKQPDGTWAMLAQFQLG
jgi:recombination protein RecT